MPLSIYLPNECRLILLIERDEGKEVLPREDSLNLGRVAGVPNIHLQKIYCSLLYYSYICIYVHVNLDFKGKQDNEPESLLFYFHRKKKAAQVGLEHPNSCFQGSCSTN